MDDKRIAGWNGLALSALAALVAEPGGDRYRPYAESLYATLTTKFWNGKALDRAHGATGPMGQVALEDYAYVARALWDTGVLAARPKPANDRNIAGLLTQAWQRFRVAEGWLSGQNTGLPAVVAQRVPEEGVLPAPAAVLMATSIAVAQSGHAAEYMKRAVDALEDVQTLGSDRLFWYASYLYPVGLAAAD